MENCQARQQNYIKLLKLLLFEQRFIPGYMFVRCSFVSCLIFLFSLPGAGVFQPVCSPSLYPLILCSQSGLFGPFVCRQSSHSFCCSHNFWYWQIKVYHLTSHITALPLNNKTSQCINIHKMQTFGEPRTWKPILEARHLAASADKWSCGIINSSLFCKTSVNNPS